MAQNKLEKVTGIQRLKSNFRQKEKIILRDFLALERTTLANERTLFSYIRSSIYLGIAGITFLNIPQFKSMLWLSYTLFGVSAIMVIYGVYRYQILKRKLRDFYDAMEREREEEDKRVKEEDKKHTSTESET